MRHKIASVLALGFMLACGGLRFSVVCRAAEPSLVTRATRIASLPDARIRYLNGRDYCWVSRNSVLLLRNDKASHNAPQTHLFLHDLTTDKETLLAKLSQRFNGEGVGLTDAVEVSPDGKWLLWSNAREEDAVPGVFGSTLDGSRHFAIQRLEARPAWLPNRSQWIALENNAGEEVTKVNVWGVDGKLQRVLPFHTPFPNLYDVFRANLVSTQNGVSLMAIHADNTGHTITMTRYALGSEVTLKQKVALKYPSGREVEHLQLSPDGKRVAWISAPENGTAHSLWISNVNGGQPQKIGQLPALLPKEVSRFNFSLRWTPDGTRLSFIYKNALWAIPVS